MVYFSNSRFFTTSSVPLSFILSIPITMLLWSFLGFIAAMVVYAFRGRVQNSDGSTAPFPAGTVPSVIALLAIAVLASGLAVVLLSRVWRPSSWTPPNTLRVDGRDALQTVLLDGAAHTSLYDPEGAASRAPHTSTNPRYNIRKPSLAETGIAHPQPLLHSTGHASQDKPLALFPTPEEWEERPTSARSARPMRLARGAFRVEAGPAVADEMGIIREKQNDAVRAAQKHQHDLLSMQDEGGRSLTLWRRKITAYSCTLACSHFAAQPLAHAPTYTGADPPIMDTLFPGRRRDSGREENAYFDHRPSGPFGVAASYDQQNVWPLLQPTTNPSPPKPSSWTTWNRASSWS